MLRTVLLKKESQLRTEMGGSVYGRCVAGWYPLAFAIENHVYINRFKKENCRIFSKMGCHVHLTSDLFRLSHIIRSEYNFNFLTSHTEIKFLVGERSPFQLIRGNCVQTTYAHYFCQRTLFRLHEASPSRFLLSPVEFLFYQAMQWLTEFNFTRRTLLPCASYRIEFFYRLSCGYRNVHGQVIILWEKCVHRPNLHNCNWFYAGFHCEKRCAVAVNRWLNGRFYTFSGGNRTVVHGKTTAKCLWLCGAK